MKSVNEVAKALTEAGYLPEGVRDNAEEILARYYPVTVEAAETKEFAEENKALDEQSIANAEDLVKTDYEMKDIGDRFIQAEIIDNSATLIDKDNALFERADATLIAACTEAAEALSANHLVENAHLEAVTKLIASLWNPERD